MNARVNPVLCHSLNGTKHCRLNCFSLRWPYTTWWTEHLWTWLMSRALELTSWSAHGQNSGKCPSAHSQATTLGGWPAWSTSHLGQAGERRCGYRSSGDHMITVGMRKSITYNYTKWQQIDVDYWIPNVMTYYSQYRHILPCTTEV